MNPDVSSAVIAHSCERPHEPCCQLRSDSCERPAVAVCAHLRAGATAGALTATAVAMTAEAGAPNAKDVPTNMRMRAFVRDQRTNLAAHILRGFG